MMRPRWHKVFSDLWGNKLRSLLVIASITIGLFAVGLITSMNQIINEDMRQGYSSVNPVNILVSASPFDDDLVNRIAKMDGVRQAEGVWRFAARARSSPDEWVTIELKAIPDIENMEINQVNLEDGVWPPDEQEFAVDRYKLADLNANLGDEVEIELPSGKIRPLRLTGVIHDQTIGTGGEGGGFFLAPVQAYIDEDTSSWLGQPSQMNTLHVTADPGMDDPEQLRELANQITEEIEDSGGIVFSTAVRSSDDHPNRVYVQAISSVLILLGFLVMFLSAFLITNTLSALLNQQTHQIGVMKTIGARRGQIIGLYMVLIMIYGLIAFLIAVPLSSRIAYFLLESLASEINLELQGFRAVPLAVLFQLLGALVVPLAAGIVPLLHGTRISAVEALSGFNSEKPQRKGWFDRQLEGIRGLSRPLVLSLRNTFRRKGRLILTLLTLTLGGAIFIATFNVQGSLTKYIARIGRYFLADVNLSLDNYERVAEIEGIVSQVPGVGDIEAWAGTGAELVMPDGSVSESVTLLAPPAGSPLVQPILLDGRWIIPGDENAMVVNERFLELFPDLKVGDTLRLKVNGEEKDIDVVGFFQISGRSGGYLAYTSYEYLSQIIHQANRANIYRITGDHPGLTLEEQEALGKQIEKELESHGISVTSTEAGQSLTATTADGLNILTGFLMVMASLIAIVGSIGLTGTMSMNVLERTREIGIIRSIGASDRAVISQVMVEGLIIGILSWLFGTLLAFPISSLMSNAINLALFGAPADFTFTPTGILIWLVVVLALSALASVIPARNAARLTIREVLAYE